MLDTTLGPTECLTAPGSQGAGEGAVSNGGALHCPGPLPPLSSSCCNQYMTDTNGQASLSHPPTTQSAGNPTS